VTGRFGVVTGRRAVTGNSRPNFGHSSRALKFPHSGHWNDLRGTEVIASEPPRQSVRKLQLSHHSLEARLFAEWVDLQLL
jgi:hypothetical protein